MNTSAFTSEYNTPVLWHPLWSVNSNQRSAKIIFFFTLTESKIHFIKTYVEDIKVIKYSFKNLVFKLTSDIQQGRATNKFIKYHLNTLLYGWNMMLNGPHRMISPTSLSRYNVLYFVFWHKKPKIFTTRPFAKKKKKKSQSLLYCS